MTPDTRTSLVAAKWGGGLLLLTAIIAFGLGADRGLDLTDESFYLLNYLHWRAATASTSLFGMYLSFPFALFDESIAAIRIFGLGLLGAAAAYFTANLYRYYDRRAATATTSYILPEVIAGSACVLIYYAVLGTLRIPSYNLLVLTCLLISSGIFLDLTSCPQDPGKRKLKLFLYGFTVSICVFTKAPAAAILMLAHLAFYLLAVPRSTSLSLPTAFVWASLGGLLNLVIVTACAPQWYSTVSSGLQFATLLDHDPWQSLTELRWHLQETVESAWQVILITAVLYAIAVRYAARRSPRVIPLLLVATIAGFSLWITLTPRAPETPWLAGQILVVCLLWGTGFLARPMMRLNKSDAILSSLVALLFTLLIGYSWGTDVALKMHTKMAAIFPLTACLLILYQTRLAGILKPTPYYACLTLLCLPALWGQVVPWVDVFQTYRLNSPLSQQESRFVFGARNSAIKLDLRTHDEVTKLSAILSASGFRPGDPLLDLTGDNPGLVLLADGTPPGGFCWLIGGYQNSLEAVKYSLTLINQDTLRHTWIISSEDNPNRIVNWRELLLARIPELTLVKVGQLTTRPNYPAMRRAPRDFTLDIWRPAP